MTDDDWILWLNDRAETLERFVDLELSQHTEEQLAENLGKYWFRVEGWNAAGYRFRSLGRDGTGSELALWLRPGRIGPSPVVLFGSEGGAGVLAPSLAAFVHALTHAPGIEEYPVPSKLIAGGSWLFDFDSDGSAKAAQERFRADVRDALGNDPGFAALVSGIDDANDELGDWVARAQQGRTTSRQKELNAQARTREEIAEELKAKRCPACGSSDLLLLKSTEIRAACRSCRHMFDPLVL